MKISPEDEKYYEDYFEMFMTDGWKRLVEDMEAALRNDQATAVQRCKTDQLWFEERGSQSRLMKILGFENVLRNTYASLEEDDKDINPE